MREYKKLFRVATVMTTGRNDDSSLYILVPQDGACWQIVGGGPGHVPLHPKQDLEVPLQLITYPDGDKELVPCWEKVGGREPVRFDLPQPYETVAEVWGPQIAERFFSPTQPTSER